MDIAVSVYAVVAIFVEASPADCVVAVTPFTSAPLVVDKLSFAVFKAATSTPSTVPDTTMFAFTV